MQQITPKEGLALNLQQICKEHNNFVMLFETSLLKVSKMAVNKLKLINLLDQAWMPNFNFELLNDYFLQ